MRFQAPLQLGGYWVLFVLVKGWEFPAVEYCSTSAVPSEPALKNKRNHQRPNKKIPPKRD